MKKIRIDSYVYAFIGIAGLFVLITFQYENILTYFNPHFKKNLSDRGQFGDSYGALNSLFSGLALAGVIISIIMQRKELRLTRDEMQLQRVEMSSARYENRLNRITNLVYLQLDKIENSIRNFEYRASNNLLLSGDQAILRLDNQLYSFSNINTLTLEQVINLNKELIDNLYEIDDTNNHLSSLILSLNNNFFALENLLTSSNLNKNDIYNLRTIFVYNVGSVNINLLNKIFETFYLLDKFQNDLNLNVIEKGMIENSVDIRLHIGFLIKFLDIKNYFDLL